MQLINKKAIILSSIILLSACGKSPVVTIQKNNDQSLREMIFANSKISTQSVSVDDNPSHTVGVFMQDSISQDPIIQSSLAQLGIYGNPASQFNWQAGKQNVTDYSDTWDDRFNVVVDVPLIADPNIIYHYVARYEASGNVTGYATTVGSRAVARRDARNDIVITSYWNLDYADISTWITSSTNPNSLGVQSYRPMSGSNVIGEDIAVPTSVRPATYAMRPIYNRPPAKVSG